MFQHVHQWRRSVLLAFVLTASGLLSTGPATAADGPISLVKSFSAGTRDSNPGQVVVAGGLGFFAADPTGRANGEPEWNELYRTDGTEAGTWMLKDVVPGDVGASPRELTALGDTLFFVADNVRVEQKLWQTDGTEAGTVPVAFDPAPGQQWRARIVGVRDGELLVVSSTFENYPSTTNVLWALRPGSPARQVASLPTAPIGDLTLLDDGRVLFVNYGTGPEYVVQLWAAETAAETEGPERLVQLPAPRTIGALRKSGNKVYFAGTTPETGSEPWVSDGTPAGTKLVLDATPGADSTEPGWIAAVGDDVYLTRSFRGLLRISGGQATELHSAGSSSPLEYATDLNVVGDRLCFLAGLDPALWCSDGSAAGTRRVSPETSETAASNLQLIAGTLYFSVNGQVWQSDGTTAGTRIYAAARTSGPPYGAGGFARLGSQLLFSATDPRYGRELWRSDGTPDGTALVRDLARTPLDSPITALPSRRGKAYFTATDAAGAFGLWQSDGTSAGTRLVTLLPAGTQTGEDGVLVGSRIVFKLTSFGGEFPEVNLWQTDGTASGTQQIQRPADLHIASQEPLVRVGSRLIFNAYSSGDGPTTVVSYDTTKRRFAVLRTQRPVASAPAITKIVATRHAAYFQSSDRKHGVELWRTDGTARGTKLVTDATRGRAGSAAPLAATAGRVFFTTDAQWGSAADEQHRQVLWSSAGTPQTTRKVATVSTFPPYGGEGSSTPRPSAIVGPNGLLLYTSFDRGEGKVPQLWASDGTRRGPRRLAASAGDGGLDQAVVLGRHVWFTIGNELWSSNGKASGTRGPTAAGGSSPAFFLTGRGSSLFFSGSQDPELWTVESPSGTPRLVQDLRPGADAGSYPRTFMFTSTHLLMTADDGTTGQQLFATRLP